MIEGVKVKQLKLNFDDRGFLTEVLKEGEEIFQDIKQCTFTETYPGVIKAFHWHKRQTDIWFFSQGLAQVVLYDLRKDSPTHKETNVFYMGEKNPLILSIPPGVAHGYRVLSQKPVQLVYFTTQSYDPENPDEERIPFNDSGIGFDWETKNR
ncbi:MAG: dTDP-4-dehydrorhamnose 3,5-epimerase family protein [Candidatus Aminicenantia bacterium]